MEFPNQILIKQLRPDTYELTLNGEFRGIVFANSVVEMELAHTNEVSFFDKDQQCTCIIKHCKIVK